MPSSDAASVIRRTVFTPSTWPDERSNPREVAQRPLPSMIMATCSGSLERSIGPTVVILLFSVDIVACFTALAEFIRNTDCEARVPVGIFIKSGFNLVEVGEVFSVEVITE